MPQTKTIVKQLYISARHFFILLLVFSAAHVTLHAQQSLKVYNSYNHDKLYNDDTIAHTAWKPIVYTDTLLPDNSSYKWLERKFFHEHLVNVQKPGFNIYADAVIDEYFGKSNRYDKIINGKQINVKTPSIDTRGYQLSGNIGSKIYFESNFYENQGKFGGYIDSFIRRNAVIPGTGAYKKKGDGSGFDFSTSSARLIYLPNKHLFFDLGYGKNFIGDGYRSLLLSDWTSNYPYFRTSITFGKFQYSAMWAELISRVDRTDNTLNNKLGYYRKWSQTYMLDWNAAPGLSVGIFESVIWPDQQHTSTRPKDISASLLSPVIFLHGSTSPSGVENNDIIGLNAKFRFYPRSYFYGQFVIDQLGKLSSLNRSGFQLGVRSGDIFEIPGLNVTAEYNTVRPYTYQGTSQDVSYSHANQSLAHPLGANFKEGIFVASYTYGKWRFRAEGFLASYGIDSGGINYGRDVSVILSSAQPPVSGTIKTTQGLLTKVQFADVKAAYILNPFSGLRLETGITYRKEYNSIKTYKDFIFSIGIRTSLNSLFYDF